VALEPRHERYPLAPVSTPDQTQQDQTPEDLPCPACRGTGRVISSLGGEPHELPCPWCDGTGRFLPGHDAQAAHPQGVEGEVHA
jgi:DnaJ-class molecular chaperone